jgi:hypothetical protein
MKKLMLIVCFLNCCLAVNAQDSTKTTHQLKVELGTLLGTATRSEGQGYSSSANNLYHIGIGYTFNFGNRLYTSIGPRLDYYSGLLYDDKNAYLGSILLQGQFNFYEVPKTLYLYGNYGYGLNWGGSFYAGNILEFGLGWQYQPKFIGKKTMSFSLGYNSTNLKNVYAERHTSSDGINVTTTSGYYRLRLKSVALNVGLSF